MGVFDVRVQSLPQTCMELGTEMSHQSEHTSLNTCSSRKDLRDAHSYCVLALKSALPCMSPPDCAVVLATLYPLHVFVAWLGGTWVFQYVWANMIPHKLVARGCAEAQRHLVPRPPVSEAVRRRLKLANARMRIIK